jgi:hypothetical protein
MGTATVTANSILGLILNATAWANVAINATSSPITNIYVSGHTADPTAAGNQTSSELAYTSYARVAVARTTSGWSAPSAGASSPVANITFPTGTGGSGTLLYWGIGGNSTGAGVLFFSGTVSPAITCGNGVTPILTTASTITVS